MAAYTKHHTKKLEDRPTQLRMLRRIIATGTESKCWEDLCCYRTYLRFKQNNPWWEKQVKRALHQFHNHQELSDPNFRGLVQKMIRMKVEKGEVSLTELLKLHQYLPKMTL